jgi:hypothetical protein
MVEESARDVWSSHVQNGASLQLVFSRLVGHTTGKEKDAASWLVSLGMDSFEDPGLAFQAAVFVFARMIKVFSHPHSLREEKEVGGFLRKITKLPEVGPCRECFAMMFPG